MHWYLLLLRRGKARGYYGRGHDRRGGERRGQERRGGERRKERGRTGGRDGKREGDAPSLTQIPGSTPALFLMNENLKTPHGLQCKNSFYTKLIIDNIITLHIHFYKKKLFFVKYGHFYIKKTILNIYRPL